MRSALKTKKLIVPMALALLDSAGLAWPAPAVGPSLAVLRSGSQAGHYLTWRGQPLLLIGDSVTQGWMECGTNFDQAAYVEALAARGLNLLMLWAYKGTSADLQCRDRRLGYDAPELWPWAGSPDDRSFDLRRFNPAYFERLRQLVQHAERRGIVVLITVQDGWTKTSFAGHPFNRTLGNGPLADRRHFVELADYDREMAETFDLAWNWREQNQYFQERLCAQLIQALASCSNVLYEMFNEGEWYDPAQRRRHERHFLRFFRARTSTPLLSNLDHIKGDALLRDDADVVTLHPKGWVGVFPPFAQGFHSAPAKPYLYSEPVPEFDGDAPPLADVRRSVWETALAGAGWVNQNDLSFGWDSRTAVRARAEIRDRAYDWAGHCARFFNQSGVRFWEMEPRGALASSGICLAQPGEAYVVLATGQPKLTVDLSARPDAQYDARWYSPDAGTFQTSGTVQGGSTAQEFVPPSADDVVLLLQRRTRR